MTNSSFFNSEITKGLFSNLDTFQTDFSGALIADTKFSNISSGKVNFSGASLSKTTIENCIINENFKDTIIDGLTYSTPWYYIEPIVVDVTQPEPQPSFRIYLNFKKSMISNSKFSNVFIGSGDLSNTVINNTVFENMHIATGYSWKAFPFSKTKLSGVTFNNAYVDAGMSNSEISGSKFNNSKIMISFNNSKLTNVEFNSSDLRNSKFNGAELNNVNFSGSDLSGATWTDGRVCTEGSIGTCN